jgi:hypothetical protein
MGAEAMSDQPLLEMIRQRRAEAVQAEAALDESEKERLGIAGYKAEFGNDALVGCTPVRIQPPAGPYDHRRYVFQPRAPAALRLLRRELAGGALRLSDGRPLPALSRHEAAKGQTLSAMRRHWISDVQ